MFEEYKKTIRKLESDRIILTTRINSEILRLRNEMQSRCKHDKFSVDIDSSGNESTKICDDCGKEL